MRWMRWAPVSIVLMAALALPGSAFGGTVLAPPGHAGAGEYFETIPTSTGDAAPPGSVAGTGNPTAGPGALAQFGHGRQGDQALTRLGKDGQAAAGLAAASAPTPVPGVTGRNGEALAAASAGSNGSASAGISKLLSGSDAGGLGALLPLLLATALIAALGVVTIARTRKRGSSGKPA